MSLIDEFENCFQACLAPITNPISSHVLDEDELKANLDNIQRFIELSQQIESFFIRKRTNLIDKKPELTLAEEIAELKHEIVRKDNLLNHYHEKLNIWSNIVNDALSGKYPNHNQIDGNAGNQMVATNQPLGHTGLRLQTGSNNQIMSPINTNHIPHVPSPLMRSQSSSGMVASPAPIMNQPSPHQPPQSPNVYNPSINQPQTPNPLAYLERTTAHIGMNDSRR
ncbi:TWiK family of potassium channels protein 18-like [Sarcoptes scabiei]|nr:TWiK family of potassium channels protein 18-like [Sarcoptes scabiei]